MQCFEQEIVINKYLCQIESSAMVIVVDDIFYDNGEKEKGNENGTGIVSMFMR